MGLAVSLFNSLLIVSVHQHWGKLFSEDPDVVLMVGQVLLIYAVFAIFDGALAVRPQTNAEGWVGRGWGRGRAGKRS